MWEIKLAISGLYCIQSHYTVKTKIFNFGVSQTPKDVALNDAKKWHLSKWKQTFALPSTHLRGESDAESSSPPWIRVRWLKRKPFVMLIHSINWLIDCKKALTSRKPQSCTWWPSWPGARADVSICRGSQPSLHVRLAPLMKLTLRGNLEVQCNL